MKRLNWRSRRLSAPEALLSAASTLFAERGYAGTSIGVLARRAGVNPALVSYHFGGKAGLRSALEARLAAYLAEPGGAAASAAAWQSDLAARLRRRPEAARLLLRDALDRAGATGPSLLERLAGDLARRLPAAEAESMAEAHRRVAALVLPLAVPPAAAPGRQSPDQGA